MNDFKMRKSYRSNVTKSIRFSEELHDKIFEVINNANKGKRVKQYSFNGFVCSACEFALDHLADEFKSKDESLK